jgi:hypothetical protein
MRRTCTFLVASLLLVLTAFSLAQDYVKENPELERRLKNASSKDREALNHLLGTMTSEDRRKFIQEMIDTAREIERNAITIQRIFAKFYPGEPSAPNLTVRDPARWIARPLSQEELAQLRAIPLNGTLEILGNGSGGVAGAQSEIRVLVVMRKQVGAPIEFPLPMDGTLMLVQMEDSWVSIPAKYAGSNKTIAIKPSTPDSTSVDFDIGNGRIGGEAFHWNR